MKKISSILAACLVFGCTSTTKSDKNSCAKQPPTTTVIGRKVLGGASSSAYIYNHDNNSDVIYFGYEYSKEQLDSVYGTCTHSIEDTDPCDGGAAYLYDEKGICIDLAYGNHNGPNERWVCAVNMDKDYYTLHISDSLEVKVGDNINDLNLPHHKYLKEIKREERNDTASFYYNVHPNCDCPCLFVVKHKNDTITFVRYDDICV